MEIEVTRASKRGFSETREVSSLEELLGLIEKSFVKPKDEFSIFDCPSAIISVQDGEWALEIYDDYVK